LTIRDIRILSTGNIRLLGSPLALTAKVQRTTIVRARVDRKRDVLMVIDQGAERRFENPRQLMGYLGLVPGDPLERLNGKIKRRSDVVGIRFCRKFPEWLSQAASERGSLLRERVEFPRRAQHPCRAHLTFTDHVHDLYTRDGDRRRPE